MRGPGGLLGALRVLRVRSVTALIVPLASANPLVEASARDSGMPPHVTLIYPFLPSGAIDSEAERAIAAVVARTPAFEVTLAEVRRFPGVVYVAPEPAEPLLELTAALAERWPEHPPYGGLYDSVVPHLTVAYDDIVPAGVVEQLPLRVRADEVWLMARALGRWVCASRYALGGPTGGL